MLLKKCERLLSKQRMPDSFLGVHALPGRSIQPHDAGAEGSRSPSSVTACGKTTSNADPLVIARILKIDHANYAIVGVMPVRADRKLNTPSHWALGTSRVLARKALADHHSRQRFPRPMQS